MRANKDAFLEPDTGGNLIQHVYADQHHKDWRISARALPAVMERKHHQQIGHDKVQTIRNKPPTYPIQPAIQNVIHVPTLFLPLPLSGFCDSSATSGKLSTDMIALPKLTRPLRLTVRTPGSHPGNTGSIPVEVTNL